MATFYNQATLSYNGISLASNVVSGELRDSLSAAKTAVTDTYTNPDAVTYAISIVNSSDTDLTGVTVTDDLGAYDFTSGQLVPLAYAPGSVKLFSDGVLQTPPTVTAGDDLVFSDITVPAGGSVVILYETTTTQFAPLGPGAEITNTAVITGGAQTDITVSETITAEDGAVLSITKSVSPNVVTDNSRLTYTFVIENTGSQPVSAEDQATVSDVFDPILTDLTVTMNGQSMERAVGFTYNDTTGEFATVPGQITVPAAVFSQDVTTGAWITQPGRTVLTVEGTV